MKLLADLDAEQKNTISRSTEAYEVLENEVDKLHSGDEVDNTSQAPSEDEVEESIELVGDKDELVTTGSQGLEASQLDSRVTTRGGNGVGDQQDGGYFDVESECA